MLGASWRHKMGGETRSTESDLCLEYLAKCIAGAAGADDADSRVAEERGVSELHNCREEFELCVRTVVRDIDFMRDRLELPIEWDGKKNGYYYTQEVDQFPQMPMNEAETFALLVAHKAIAQYHDTPFQRPLEAAFRRLTGQLDQSVRFSMGGVEKMPVVPAFRAG